MSMQKSEIASYVIFLNGAVIAMSIKAMNHLLNGGSVNDGLTIEKAYAAVGDTGNGWEHEIFGIGVIRKFDHRPTLGELSIAAVTTYMSIGIDAKHMQQFMDHYGDYMNSPSASASMN